MVKQKIIRSFDLYSGKRPKEQDDEIFEKVSVLCLEETIKFLEENFDLQISREDIKKDYIRVLLEQKSREVPDFKFRLNSRLGAFVDNLLLETLEKI